MNEQANVEIKLLRDYISDLEKGLESSLNLNKAQAERQAKTLTDEEIAQEWGKFYPDVFHTHLIDFARAILRKAQEK